MREMGAMGALRAVFAAGTPTVHVISDALGDTACEVALAACAQFDEGSVQIARLPKVTSAYQVDRYLATHLAHGERFAVFHTIASDALRAEVEELLARFSIPSVDLLGPAVATIASLTGAVPHGVPGTIHRTDERYFHRIEAMEYAVDHDDGRGADDLSEADIVLIGVSRTGKTPLSMYLAFQGYRVANIPLASGLEPPAALFDVDPAKLFGLLSTVDVVADIRDARLGDEMARAHAGLYADAASVASEMEEAHALMRRLGCFVVRTDRKAIEESASEIIVRIQTVAAARAHRKTTRDS